MSMAALIRQMTEAGAPPEAIAIAIEAIEAARASAAAEIEGRRANDRERKQRSRDGHVTVTGRSRDGDVTPSPKKEKSPHTPLKEKTTPPDTPMDANASMPPQGGDGKKTPRQILLECLSPDIADAVLAHRKAMRRPLTGRAAQLLAKGFLATADPNGAADMMIERGWQGFKPEWFDNERAGNGQGRRSGKGSIVEAGRRLTERLVAERREREREVQPGNSVDPGDPIVRLLPGVGGQRS